MMVGLKGKKVQFDSSLVISQTGPFILPTSFTDATSIPVCANQSYAEKVESLS